MKLTITIDTDDEAFAPYDTVNCGVIQMLNKSKIGDRFAEVSAGGYPVSLWFNGKNVGTVEVIDD